MSNRRDIQFTYSPHNKLTLLDASFICDSTNGNGFGIRSLKPSGRIATVFMYTSATPGTASNGQVNPNPQAGIIVVTLQDNYNRYLAGGAGMSVHLSGSNISSGMTIGNAYVITSVGASTQAQFTTAGLPAQIVPAVGASFIAAATSVAGGGLVQAVGASSGIDHIEIVGDANQMNSNGAAVSGGGLGMQLILACYSGGVLTAPTNGSVIGLTFQMNNSAQGV